jgi:hypothetical protein
MNVFGSTTGIRVKVLRGYPLPAAPIGHSWSVAESDGGEC